MKEILKKQVERENNNQNMNQNVMQNMNQVENTNQTLHTEYNDGKFRCCFLYENMEGVIYNDLKKLTLKEGDTVKIFPVYLAGTNDNLNEEEVLFKNGKLTPSEENKESTWLTVINSTEPDILVIAFDLSDVVVYNNKFFHCIDDLYYWLQQEDAEYLAVL